MDIDTPLPAGIVTFFLTDIEGSTRLWEERPEAMQTAVARHDALAAAVIRQHRGVLVKQRCEGDSLFAVFALARDAVPAAVELQRALKSEPWPAGIILRVRVAIHTGSCEPREGDYYGAAVNCCARLRDAAHGGQVLLSGATQEQVRDHLPPEASLRDLGTHRLRDLQRAAHIFQLVHPSLPVEFPLLRHSAGSGRRRPKVSFISVLVLMLIATVVACLPLLSARHTVGQTYSLVREIDNSRGMTIGASVRMAGVKIGEVESISLDPSKHALIRMRILAQNVVGPRDGAVIGTEGPFETPCIDILPERSGSAKSLGVGRRHPPPFPSRGRSSVEEKRQ